MNEHSHMSSHKSLANEHFNRDNSLNKSRSSTINVEGGDRGEADHDVQPQIEKQEEVTPQNGKSLSNHD